MRRRKCNAGSEVRAAGYEQVVVCLGNHTQSILAVSVRCKAEGWGWVGIERFSRANSLRLSQSASFTPLSHDITPPLLTNSELLEGCCGLQICVLGQC